ncbi:MAG TPA: hypothetical protein VN240_03970 [Propylenella sp.]|nr:hypothetical protein [Propylenella sp.]
MISATLVAMRATGSAIARNGMPTKAIALLAKTDRRVKPSKGN